MSFLSILDEGGNFWTQYGLIFVLLALIIVMYVFSFSKRKKYNQQVQDMVNSLKPGDKVKTYSGFYGTIVSIKETTDGKVVLLETGEGSKVSYTTIDVNAIYGIDAKEDVVYDKDGNVILDEEKSKENNSSKEEKAKKSKTEKDDEVEEPKVVEAEATEVVEEKEEVAEIENADNKDEIEELEALAEGKSTKNKKSK